MKTTKECHISSKVGQITPLTVELAALECLEKSLKPYTRDKRNVAALLALSFLIGSTSILRIKVWRSLTFGQTPPLILDIAALERLKNQCLMLWPL